MMERMEHILFLTRYSTELEIISPFIAEMDKKDKYEKNSALCRFVEAVEFLKNDEDVEINIINDYENDISKIHITRKQD